MRKSNSRGHQELLSRKSKPARQVSVENQMPFLDQDTKLRIQPAVRPLRSAEAARSRRRGGENTSTRETVVSQRTHFEDPTNVQNWAASSAPGSDPNCTDFYQGGEFSVEPALSSGRSMFSACDLDIIGSLSPAYPDFLYSPESPMFPGGDVFGQGSKVASFPYSFTHADAPMMEFSTSTGGATSSSREFTGSDASFSGSALSSHFYMEASSEDDIPMCLDYPPWSPSTASADLSLSSGCPSGSLMPSNFLGSPIDIAAAEDLTTVPSNDGMLQFTLGQSALSQGSYNGIHINCSDSGTDSTARTSQSVQLGSYEVAYALPHNGVRAKAFYSTRLGSDGENIKARQHELYNVGPGPDGLYHCPYVRDGECSRKPDKLKCNYDKHMDSHLKPYRCQDPACDGVPFSSTACLLRHEREAHGLHGHGDRPYSCYFDGCERATPGYGFPRRWNLQDHMRRVHNFVLPDVESSGCTESSGSRKKKSSQAVRTRRGSRQGPARTRA